MHFQKILVRNILLFCCLLIGSFALGQQDSLPLPAQVATDFKKMLERPVVDFKPSFEITNTDSVIIENGFIYSEANERIPILIYKPVRINQKSFPVVICLHGTGGNKDQPDIHSYLVQFSKRGIIGVSIDARYHGERLQNNNKAGTYAEAITRAWRNTNASTQEHPFFYDTVFDLWRLTDYLVTRADVQAGRIGMTGISMGGIETWMAASVDTRIKVAVPMIAAQSFKWSLENDRWQGRAGTITAAHLEAAKDLGDTSLNKENVRKVWEKILPGITGEFHCPAMIRLFAPRSLLLLNTEKDQNCPLPGALIAFKAAEESYLQAGVPEKLKTYVEPNEPHRITPTHEALMFAWFEKWL